MTPKTSSPIALMKGAEVFRRARPSFSLSHTSGRLTLAVLAMVLMLLWGGGTYALFVVKASKEKELELRLETIGRIEAERLFEKINLDMLSLAVPEKWSAADADAQAASAADDFLNVYGRTVESFLQKVVQQGQLRRAMLVDIHRRAIADSAAQAEAFEPYAYLDIDRFEIEEAQREKDTVATPYYSVQGEPYKRSYTPLQDENGRIVAFLQLEASSAYFSEMQQLPPQLISLMSIITVLILLVGLLFYRLLRFALRAEQTAAQADRLQAVGTLAAGFAHEVRNPLSILRSYAEGLADEFTDTQSDLKEMTREMVEEVLRVDSLITQFLNFARPGGMETWGEVPLKDLVESVLRLVRKELADKQLQIAATLEDALPPVWADEKALRQVLLNVLLNARDATEPQGTITVELRSRRDRVLLRIQDNGCGIEAENLERVFEPFYTTKSTGTGLGLALSRNIIEQFGGEISIKSQAGRGTVVEIALPARKE